MRRGSDVKDVDCEKKNRKKLAGGLTGTVEIVDLLYTVARYASAR